MHSACKTNLTCIGILVYIFRHPMGAIIRGSSGRLKQCFRNGPTYGSTVAHQHTDQNISIIIFNQ